MTDVPFAPRFASEALAGEPKPFSEEALYRDCFIQHHVTYYVILNQTAIAWLKPCYASEASDDGPVGGIGRVGQLAGLGLPKVGLWQIFYMADFLCTFHDGRFSMAGSSYDRLSLSLLSNSLMEDFLIPLSLW